MRILEHMAGFLIETYRDCAKIPKEWAVEICSEQLGNSTEQIQIAIEKDIKVAPYKYGLKGDDFNFRFMVVQLPSKCILIPESEYKALRSEEQAS